MDAEKLLRDWLNLLKWEDDVVADELDPETFMVDTPLRIANYFWRLIVRASGGSGLISVRLYAPIVALDGVRPDVIQFMNAWNARHLTGAFALLDDGRLCFRTCADFEGLSPGGRSVALMFGPAADTCREIHEALFAVALGQKSLPAALADLNAEPESRDDGQPSEGVSIH